MSDLEVIYAIYQKIQSLQKNPLHFRKVVKCQNRQGLNWVSRTVLSPDNYDVGIF